MKKPLVSRAYDRLNKREAEIAKTIQSKLESTREERVTELAREALDQKVREANAAPRPKGMPGPSRDELAKAAKHDAEVTFAREVQTELAKTQQESMERRREFLNDVKSRPNIRDSFNEATRGDSR